jgi:predicted DNA-binding protein
MLNTQKKTKETQVGVRMDTETRKRLETAAARESRTISDMARLLISEGLKRRKVA